MKPIYFIVTLFFSINAFSQDTITWVKYDLGNATIELPAYFSHTKLRGIDSKVGKFSYQSFVIKYDLCGFEFIDLNDTCNLVQEEKEILATFDKDWFKALYHVPEKCSAHFVVINDNPGEIIETKNPIGEMNISVLKCNSDLYFNIQANDLTYTERQLVLKIGNTIKFE